MALSAGTRLGPYEILAPLGAGGVTVHSVHKKEEAAMRKLAGSLLAASVYAAATIPAVAQEPLPQAQVDSYIENAMENWQVPGLAVVVMRGDSAILLKGYGTRIHGETLEVNPKTYLQIASNSKTVTAFAIGMLVDEGKLRWDDPIKKHIPELQLSDPYVTEHVAIDDLLCHRSGLSEAVPGGFNNPDFGLQELLEDIKVREMTYRFRSRNNYSQFGMALLGEVILRVTKLHWGEFVRKRIFAPLGMESSYTSNADFADRVGKPAEAPNIMHPAIKTAASVGKGSWDAVGSQRLYAPAAGIISTLEDLAKWISFRLNDGVHEGARLISLESVKEIRAPRIPTDFARMSIPLSYMHPRTQLMETGYGQYSFEHRGRRVIMHNGGWMGSVIAIVPSEKFGVGIFSNAWFEPSGAASLAFVNGIALAVLDHQLGHRDVDWSREMLGLVAAP
jgi:CubicO group peptidase (beta-lactamase class C family)